MPLIDSGVYRDGMRVDSPATVDATIAVHRARAGMVWLALGEPTELEIQQVAAEFRLHPLAVEDAMTGHQRSKLERYGDTLFVVLRPARYDDAEEKVRFGEFHIFAGRDFVVTIRHAGTPGFGNVRERLEAEPGILELGPQAVVYGFLDEVVDEYEPVVAGLENDIDEIEDQLFGEDDDERVARRIYELSREVMAFQRAVHPLEAMLAGLLAGADKYGLGVELVRMLRDVHDHVERTRALADSYRAILDNALQVQSTLVMREMTRNGLAQNEQMKKITAWAAILFAPSLVGSVYGMNFDRMPELHWALGYPFALALMVVVALALYVAFKARHWL